MQWGRRRRKKRKRILGIFFSSSLYRIECSDTSVASRNKSSISQKKKTPRNDRVYHSVLSLSPWFFFSFVNELFSFMRKALASSLGAQLECHPEFETLFSIEDEMRKREKRRKKFSLSHRVEVLTVNLFDRIVLYFLDR